MATIAGQVSLAVHRPEHVHQARRLAEAVCLEAGLSQRQSDEVSVAVAELATNLVRYASAGRLGFDCIGSGRRRGILVTSEDNGPGIADLAAALSDGFSTGGGLGSGLPGVRRLMDQVEVRTSPAGTRIDARKWATGRPE